MRKIEGKLLYLQLSLEQIHWVFILWIWNTMNWELELIELKGYFANFLIKIVDKSIYLYF